METKKAIEFIITHWEVISVVALWLAARLIKTQKNYDFVEMIIKFIGDKIIPNRVKKSQPLGAGDDYPVIDAKEFKKKEDANGGEK